MAALVAVILLAAGAAACSRRAPEASPPTTKPTVRAPAAADGAACPRGADLPTGTSNVKLTSHGFAREYFVYAPASYTGRTPVPVLLEFHGFGGAAQQQMLYGNFGPAADRDGFLVVGPQGQGQPRHFTLRGAAGGEQDDVEFVADLLDHLERTLCVDRTRVYSTGMSNGGAMTSVLACRLSDRIAAFASVAAVVWAPQCEAARTVPIIAFHGTADPIVPFDGGQVRCCGNPTIPGAPETMANWARHDGCGEQPADEPVKGSVTLRRWTGCREGGVVGLYIVGGGGHTWPGARGGGSFLGGASQDVDASEVIWDFFKDKRLPTA